MKSKQPRIHNGKNFEIRNLTLIASRSQSGSSCWVRWTYTHRYSVLDRQNIEPLISANDYQFYVVMLWNWSWSEGLREEPWLTRSVYNRCLHTSRLCSHRRSGRFRRLVLSLPRLTLRHLRTSEEGACTAESRSSSI